jgi:uncharacterized protein (DUF1697 family)
MTAFIALLRAVNVGGTGALPMSELRDLCEALGFKGARTYIQSGNVVLESRLSEAEVKAALEEALASRMGKPVGVMVRTAAEMAAVLAGNPYPNGKPSHTYVMFLDEPPAEGVLEGVVAPDGEELAVGTREIYVHYARGMGTSKLKVPGAKAGTARNMNTVAKLVEMAAR